MRARDFAESLRGFGKALPILAKGGDWAWSFRNEWQHFANAIQKGERVGCSVEDGVRVAEIQRLKWSDLNQGDMTVNISKDVAKKHKARPQPALQLQLQSFVRAVPVGCLV